MLKKTGSSAPTWSGHTRINENEFDTKGDSTVNGDKIDDKIANLLNSMKVKKSFGMGFFTFEASLAFTQ